MIKEGVKYDLCQLMLDELMVNLEKIKGDRKGTFQYGSLFIYLLLFFLNKIPGSGRKQWAFDMFVGKPIQNSLIELGEN